MGDTGQRLCLAQEPFACLGEPSLGESPEAHQLERELAVELGIVSGVDDAHSAHAEQFQHDVAAHGAAAREKGSAKFSVRWPWPGSRRRWVAHGTRRIGRRGGGYRGGRLADE
jgi:hypothetical protein